MNAIRLAVSLPVGALWGLGLGWLALAAVGGGWSDTRRAGALLAASLLGLVVAALKWMNTGDPVMPTSHGSARFGALAKAKRTLGGGEGLIIGRAPKGWLLRYAGPSHLLTVAPTRSGKGVGAILPNLLTLDRSMLCIDPKGENARIAARARGGFGPVHVLDPFEATGLVGAAFNPLADLDPFAIDVAEAAALIAEALVDDPPDQVSEAHWNEEAKALLAGVILHVVSAKPGRCALTDVREILTRPPQAFQAELMAMQKSGAANGLVARAANRHLGKSDREAAGVLSAAQRHTHFLDSPRMAQVLSRSDFQFADLKAGVVSVFIVLPPERLATHARWLRLLVLQALNALAQAPRGAGKPVLFLLDEFAALGRLEPVERAFGLMAGYGVQLWAFLQDLHQLRGLYGVKAGTFLSNAGVTQVFNVADVETAAWVSRSLGVATQAFQTTGTSVSSSPNSWGATHGTSTTQNLTRRDLMTPDEVMRMGSDQLLLLRPGEAPLMARKVRYFADGEFQGLFDA